MNSKTISLINRLIDYLKFDKHRKIRIEIASIKNELDQYDYGEGYFYQSLSKINLSGLRNTKDRKNFLNITEYTKNKKILDIGTNSGFLLFELDNNFKYALGIDYNPSLIKIGNIVKKYLNIKNIELKCENIYEINHEQKYDIVLSLANHSTFDNGINETDRYFKKVYALIKKNGILIFESHHPQYESLDIFDKYLKELLKYYKLIEQGVYNTKNFYDNKRKFVILKKIND